MIHIDIIDQRLKDCYTCTTWKFRVIAAQFWVCCHFFPLKKGSPSVHSTPAKIGRAVKTN